MARQKLNYTQGDAEPKKKGNQKRSQLATGQSTGDVSQVDLSFKTPHLRKFRVMFHSKRQLSHHLFRFDENQNPLLDLNH